MPRTAEIARKTKETDITVKVDLDGNGTYDIDTGIGFFDHMLSALSKHSGINMDIKCKGDLEVDAHHSVEDVGIVLGQAVCKALGDKVGIRRFGSCAVPMD
ncbi:MAG: imidazoleglycerol-phosphate dehydratase, partial [Saccharofermentans sp.]|nr:imidazoleglycerol-phosphate dehydratase [Saccharofermentans sp.]